MIRSWPWWLPERCAFRRRPPAVANLLECPLEKSPATKRFGRFWLTGKSHEKRRGILGRERAGPALRSGSVFPPCPCAPERVPARRLVGEFHRDSQRDLPPLSCQ